MRAIKKALRRLIGRVWSAIDRRVQASRRGPERVARTIAPIDDLPSQSALVVIAHPDDDVISSGALLARLPRAGVVWVTDGAPRKGSFAQEAGFDNWPDYGLARRREAEAALALLQRELSPMYNLGIADRDAVFDVVALTHALMKPLKSGFKYVITHAYEGGHPDHDATALGVHAACALIARAGGTPPTIIEAPLYNSPGGEFTTQTFLPHPDAGPTLGFNLSAQQQDLKRRMYLAHASQRSLLQDFRINTESFRVAPRYHFTSVPHPGDVGYNEFHWQITGRRWRNRVWRTLHELDLVRELA
ncbi:MAG: PIG-L family deacetylase [Alphaproteobacteria bacterium]